MNDLAIDLIHWNIPFIICTPPPSTKDIWNPNRSIFEKFVIRVQMLLVSLKNTTDLKSLPPFRRWGGGGRGRGNKKWNVLLFFFFLSSDYNTKYRISVIYFDQMISSHLSQLNQLFYDVGLILNKLCDT